MELAAKRFERCEFAAFMRARGKRRCGETGRVPGYCSRIDCGVGKSATWPRSNRALIFIQRPSAESSPRRSFPAWTHIPQILHTYTQTTPAQTTSPWSPEALQSATLAQAPHLRASNLSSVHRGKKRTRDPPVAVHHSDSTSSLSPAPSDPPPVKKRALLVWRGEYDSY